MIVKEFRVILPMTVEEYQVAQLWSVAEMSKQETGGGDGIVVYKNEPFDLVTNPPLPNPLLDGSEKWNRGQYTHKRYFLYNKVPRFIKLLAPKGSLEVDEIAWNAYPYCRTVVNNPQYMKDGFFIKIETYHAQNDGSEHNMHMLSSQMLNKREVVIIDIANDQCVSSADYKPQNDPRKVRSERANRGPLLGKEWWKNSDTPIMCAYKLVTCEFKWFGFQGKVEEFIMKIMAPQQEYVNGIAEYRDALEKYEGRRVFAIFCASIDEESGQSWCPDCRDAEPVVEEALNLLSDDTVFLYVEVGDRPTWKDPENAFRKFPGTLLTGVPTLLEVGTDKRLEPGDCAKSELVSAIFK